MRRVLVLLTALALVWSGGCSAPEDESAWLRDARPLLERAGAVKAEMSRGDFDPAVSRSLILETRAALAAFEPVDEHGAEFEQLIRDAMDYYGEGLKAYEARLPEVSRQWIGQANETIAEARRLVERYEQER